jgi:hypothetical protein
MNEVDSKWIEALTRFASAVEELAISVRNAGERIRNGMMHVTTAIDGYVEDAKDTKHNEETTSNV